MPDYTSKYIFEASARGFTALNRQLEKAITNVNALKQAAAGGINVTAGTGTGTGGTASGGTAGGGTATGAGTGGSSFAAGSYLPNVSHITRALGYATALGAVYRIMEMGSEVATRWVDVQTEYNRALVDGQNILGLSAEQVKGFGDQVKYLAYISGEGTGEASMVAQRERILNRPGMGASASALNMVFPTLDLSNSAQDLTAIQTQFHASFNDINRVLLTLVQTSGLTAEELMGMSDTWGALVNDMRLGERSLTSMRQIGALMSMMSIVMGETGTSIEQFLRKMERIYTDPKAAKALDDIGISVTNASGQMRSFIDILNEISEKGLGAKAYQVLEPLFPNDLGQATKQQLRELFLNIDTIVGGVDTATNSLANFDETVIRAANSTDNLKERLGEAFDNWLSATGDISGATMQLSSLAAGLQNASIRRGGGIDYDSLIGRPEGQIVGTNPEMRQAANEIRDAIMAVIPRSAEWESGRQQNVIAMDFVSALPKDFFGNVTDASQQRDYLRSALAMFKESQYFQPEHDPGQALQDFLLYMSQYKEVVDAASIGVRDSTAADQEAFAGHVIAVDGATEAMGVFANAAYLAAGDIVAFSDMASVFLPTFYNSLNNPPEVKQATAELAERKAGYRPDPYAAGYNAIVAAVDPQDMIDGYAKLQEMGEKGTYDAYQRDQRLAEQAYRQQQSSWERLMDNFEREWNSMLDSITKPTAVTAADMVRSQAGGYQDKWDEPMRQWNADVNNVTSGKGAQWDFGGLSQYVDQQLLGMAKGADIDTQKSIFAGLTEELSGKYYGLQLPPEAYNQEALVASAQDYIAGKQQSKQTRTTMEGWLKDAGIDKTLATEFLGMQDTPPIVQALTGGKTASEITETFKGYVPDTAKIVSEQFTDVSWVLIVASAMTNSIKDNEKPIEDAGSMFSEAFNKGFAGKAAETIIAKLLAALAEL